MLISNKIIRRSDEEEEEEEEKRIDKIELLIDLKDINAFLKNYGANLVYLDTILDILNKIAEYNREVDKDEILNAPSWIKSIIKALKNLEYGGTPMEILDEIKRLVDEGLITGMTERLRTRTPQNTISYVLTTHRQYFKEVQESRARHVWVLREDWEFEYED